MFYFCQITLFFWKDLIHWLHTSCTHLYSLNLSVELIFMGLKTKIKTDKVFDLIQLVVLGGGGGGGQIPVQE